MQNLEKLKMALSVFQKDAFTINLTAVEVGSADLKQSKLRGFPYIPEGEDLPMNASKRLRLLAQINFSEVPPHPDFPERGILQFYLSDTPSWGQDYDQPFVCDDFQVRFWANSDLPYAHFEEGFIAHYLTGKVARAKKAPMLLKPFLKPETTIELPIDGEIRLSFQPKLSQLSGFEVEFQHLTGYNDLMDYINAGAFGEHADGLSEAYLEAFDWGGCQLLGYPYFTQEDPRIPTVSKHTNKKNNKHQQLDLSDYLLLFQIDSYNMVIADAEQFHADIMWGDAGVANFFIKPEDLKARRFERMIYYWDCS